MAWLKEKSGAWPPVGLPPFQPRPLPSSLANGAGSLSSQASLEGVGAGGLSAAHSTDTQGSTAEEDELSRELTMELLQDMCLRAQDGAAPPMSRRSSAHPTSRRASVSLSLQPQQSEGGGSVATVDTAVHPAAVGEEEEEEELEGWRDEEEEEDLQPSLYDQLGGGVVVKALVDEFYRRVLCDEQLQHFFEGVDMAKHTRKFMLFATYVLGGPDEYLQLAPQPWPTLYQAHERLIRDHGLVEAHFDMIGQHFKEAMEHVKAEPRLINLALSIVEQTRRIIFPRDAAPKPRRCLSNEGPRSSSSQREAEEAVLRRRSCDAVDRLGSCDLGALRAADAAGGGVCPAAAPAPAGPPPT